MLDFINKRNDISNTLKKFNINCDNGEHLKVYIDNKKYDYVENIEIGYEEVNMINIYNQTVLDDGTVITEHIDSPEANQILNKGKLNLQIALLREVVTYGSEHSWEYLYLKDLNLINPSASLRKIQEF